MKTIADTLTALQKLRVHVAPSMSLTKATVFLLVASNDGISQADISVRANLIRDTASKALLDLSTTTSRKAQGPGLIETRPAPKDRRHNLVYLTAKGRRVAKKVLG